MRSYKHLIRTNRRGEGQGLLWRREAMPEFIFGRKPKLHGRKSRGNFDHAADTDAKTIGAPLPCDWSCASRSWKPEQSGRSLPHSSCGRTWPTSDFRIAAVRTSWCTAFLLSSLRSCSSTAESSRSTQVSARNWPERRRIPLPEELLYGWPERFCSYVFASS